MKNLLLPSNFKKLCLTALLVVWASFIFSKALTEVGVVTALISWILWHTSARSWKITADRKLLWMLASLMAWTLLTLFWSEAPKQSLRGLQKVGEQILIFLMVLDLFRDRESFSKWEKVFLIFAAIAAANAGFQYLTGKDLIRRFAMEQSGAGWRVNGSFKTYGLFANFLICTIPILTGFLLRLKYKKPDILRTAGVVLVFTASIALLYLTRSRGAMLAFLTGTLISLLYQRKFLLLIVGAAAITGIISIIPHHELIHLDIERKEQSIVERFYLWDRAVNVIKARPVTGTGINTYAVAHQKYDTTQNWRVRNYYAHNGYLQMAAETGIPGLALFLLFVFYCFLQTLKTLRRLIRAGDKDTVYLLGSITVGILNFLAMSLADTVLHNPPSVKLFWYLLGLQMALVESVKNRLEAPR